MKSSRSLKLALIGLALTCAAVTGRAAPPGADVVREILVQRISVGEQAPGIVLGIVNAQGRQVFAHGVVANDDPRPLNGDSVFPIASVTKVFTALLLAELVQRGDVALDDPVAKFLPADRVSVPSHAGRSITLIDLATHTAGLPERARGFRPKDPANPFAELSVEQGYRLLSQLELRRDIGSAFEYTNFGYGLLGHALALREGVAYESLLRTRVLAPLALNDTTFAPDDPMRPRLVPGHNAQLERVPNWDFAALAPAGALHSSANDLLTLLEAFIGLRDTPLKTAMQAMLVPRRPGGFAPATSMALGWMIVPSGASEIAWHAGRVAGHRSFIGFDARQQLGVVVLANANSPASLNDIGLHLLNASFPLAPQTAEVRLDPATLDRFVGRYEFNPGFAYTITRDAKRLYIQPTGYPRSALYARGGNQFFLRSMNAQVQFEAADGEPARALVFSNREDGRDSRAVKS